MSNIIEKAKWQVGDIKTDKNGNQWECSGFSPSGTPKWRKPKGSKSQKQDDQPSGGKKPAANQTQPKGKSGGGGTDFSSMNPDQLVDYAKNAKTSALAAVVNNKSIDLFRFVR